WPANRARCALLPLTGGLPRSCASCERQRREHPSHGRGLLQGRWPGAAPGAAPRERRASQYQGRVVVDTVIIDSGGANLASLQFAFERLGGRARVSADPAEIQAAPRVILPGVGSAPDAMSRLRGQGLADLLPALTQPVLGICLGMQLLCA